MSFGTSFSKIGEHLFWYIIIIIIIVIIILINCGKSILTYLIMTIKLPRFYWTASFLISIPLSSGIGLYREGIRFRDYTLREGRDD